MAKRAKLYDITVDGYGRSIQYGTSAADAQARVWRTDPFSHLKFGDFLRICRAKMRTEPAPAHGYDYVRHNYGVDPAIGQRVNLRDGRQGEVAYPGECTAHVHVIVDGRDFATPFHPTDVVLPPYVPAPHPQEARHG